MSGKSTVGVALAQRTNAKLIKFDSFVKESGLDGSDDDTIVLALIQSLSNEITPRVIIENFPQTKYQAKFFLKNGILP
jgi:adenylate kinase family enzyme